MNPFNNLSEANHEQIRKYLRFFRQKREGILRTVGNEFVDVKTDRLHEEMYSRDDVEEILDFLQTSVKNQVGADLGTLINMGSLTVSQLLESSQLHGVELDLDTGVIENQMLLEEIERMSLDAMPKQVRRGIGELMSFKDEAKAKREETERLEGANRRLQEDIDNLRARLAYAEQQKAQLAERKGTDERDSRSAIESLERRLAESKEDADRRVSDTTQFQQMRRMMQTQSATIRDLRRRLQRYEPDAVKEDD